MINKTTVTTGVFMGLFFLAIALLSEVSEWEYTLSFYLTGISLLLLSKLIHDLIKEK